MRIPLHGTNVPANRRARGGAVGIVPGLFFLLLILLAATGSLSAQEERVREAIALRDQARETIRQVSADARYYQLWLDEVRHPSSWFSGMPHPTDPVMRAMIFYQSRLPGTFARLEERSPSGDWSRLTDYTFDPERRIAVIDSTLNTFHGDVTVERTFVFDIGGSVIHDEISITDLTTGKPIAPDQRSFEDRPPEVFFTVRELKGMLGR